MAIFALLQGDMVRNCIVAETLEDVVEAFPNFSAVEMTEVNSPAYIHGRWDGVRFIPPPPGDDWDWDEESNEWVMPLPDTVLVEIGDE